jgi:threonine aldolase
MKRSAAKRTTPAPRAASRDIEQYRARCTRWLAGHGPRSAADLLATVPTDLGIDRYGEGAAVGALEAEMRKVLGKPAAVFMPSGTMAQQIALRIHADRRGPRAIGWHPTCHLEIHEDKAHQRLHDLVGVPIGNARTLMTLDDLRAVKEPLAAMLFELPQREIGGQLPPWRELREQVAFVRRTGAAVHLDGARLWESAPFYRKSPAQVAALFDTVYVSFYKGLGSLAGACLAGETDVIEEARAWRKRHGGTLFGLWVHAGAALAGLRERLPRMPRYVAHAQAIARALKSMPNVEVVPDPPQTPMMHLHLRVSAQAFQAAACRIAREQRVYTWPRTVPGPTPGIRVVEFVVGDATLALAPREVAAIIGELAA